MSTTDRPARRPTPPPAPRKEPPPDAAERIHALAADGWSLRGIASHLGIGYDLLNGRWFTEYPELREAFETGRSSEELVLRNVLFQIATDESNAPKDRTLAALSILNARHGWRSSEAPTDAGRVNVTVNLPAARPLEEVEIDDGNGRTATVQIPATRT